MLLLFWKCLLLSFGNLKELDNAKMALRSDSSKSKEEYKESLITTSPLDYHLFRQEIISKYPTYTPPPPLLPLEPENNSVLPPLPGHLSRRASRDESNQSGTGTNVGGSIINQPVHIATPAPSPPPSPGGPGGKGAKKQNYQTNQNFPFLFPPIEDNEITLGESAKLHEKLIGKRWQDGNVPASILEAGQLFASRMRMSRSIRQLWDVRERYIREERGWGGTETNADGTYKSLDDVDDDDENDNDEHDDDDGDSELESPVCNEKEANSKAGCNGQHGHDRPKESDDDEAQARLDGVDNFYVGSPYGLFSPC